jgi:2-oxoglutarate dehydrogenase E2 component (dihydrolipoamide succinyltransferase)
VGRIDAVQWWSARVRRIGAAAGGTHKHVEPQKDCGAPTLPLDTKPSPIQHPIQYSIPSSNSQFSTPNSQFPVSSMADIKIPAAGESITTAVIATWHKNDGDTVAIGDPLLTLETDKVAMDLSAEAAGVLKIVAPAGSEVAIDAVVGSIDPAAPPAARTPTPEPAPEPASKKSAKSQKPERPLATPAQTASAPTASPPAASAAGAPLLATPPPSTAGATASTPPAEPAASAPAPAAAAGGRTTRTKLSPLRRKIATQLVNAQQTAAILTTFNEADLSAVMAMRKQLQESFTARHGIKLGLMSFFVKATVDALKAVPQVNSRLDGDEFVQNHFYDIGVAVATPRGLVVPVIRDCETRTFAEIERAIADIAAKARDGKLVLTDLQGGVFTISNGGTYGSLLSTPILNPPQSGILGMHTIQERPVVRDGQIVIRPMMYLALSYDHRVVDGKEAVTFLVRIKECLENPARLLLGA